MATVAEREYEFDLVFALPEEAGDEDDLLDALYEAGCDDAAVGVGASGLVGLGFRRAGPEEGSVISATINQVRAALPKGATLRKVQRGDVIVAQSGD